MGQMKYVVSVKHVYGICSLYEVDRLLKELGAEILEVVNARKIIFDAGHHVEHIAERLYSSASAEALYRYFGDLSTLYSVEEGIRLDFEGVKPPVKKSIISKLRERGVFLREEGPLYLVLGTRDGVDVYRALVEYRRDRFKPRSPEKRVFFLSSALNPLSALLLINLSLTPHGYRLLDPFSGTGSILIEGALAGLYTVGVEIDYRQVRGALRNIRQFGLQGHVDLVLADSMYAPFRDGCFDAVATDPPYGRYASTRKRPVEEVYRGLLELSSRVIGKGKAAFFAPQWVKIPRDDQLEEVCSIYIHSDLTRRLWVYHVDS